jgi:hypothetical protein
VPWHGRDSSHTLHVWRARRWRLYLFDRRHPYTYGFHLEAMCIHRHESIDWHEPGGIGPQVSGGMQIGVHEWWYFGGGRWSPAAYLAAPWTQVLIAYRYHAVSGWAPWPLSRLACGV